MREGYVFVMLPRGHALLCMADGDGYVRENRFVMAEYLKRPLEAYETVHHINGDKLDNRLENLQLRIGQHGTGAAFRCRDCGSINIEAVPLVNQDGIVRTGLLRIVKGAQ